MCGEQVPADTFPETETGSPPRVRGTAFRQTIRRWELRITPACAGNRNRQKLVDMAHTDHPRVCGEQLAEEATPEIKGGSPPRVRGTGICTGGEKFLMGITPACAGNRANTKGGGVQKKDHPRVCGEQTTCIPMGNNLSGSPPRVRGTVIMRNTRLSA